MASTRESPLDRETQIEVLKEDNFSTWFVDIRAKLRSKKLWVYTQSPYGGTEETETGDQSVSAAKKVQKAIKDWEDKSQEAEDLMTPTISRVVKRKLTELEFNDS